MTFERLMTPLEPDERFDALRDLAAVFSSTPRANWGYRQEEIEAARLAIPSLTQGASGPYLPAALIRWWREVGRVRELTASQNTLLAPDRLKVRDDGLIIDTEAQHCALWGIRIADLALDDPPIIRIEDRDWHPEADTLSEFALTVGLSELCISGSNHHCTGYTDDAGIASLRSAMTTLPVSTLRWPSPTRDSCFLADENMLALIEEEFIFAVGTQANIQQHLAGLVAPGMIEWTTDTGLE